MSHTGQGLFQETLRFEPFWLLVACILVNRTRWTVAEPVLIAVRERWQTTHELSWARFDELEEVLHPLGFGRQRAKRLIDLAREWQRIYVFENQRRARSAEEVLALPGCGRYAADSWSIFVEESLDVEPTDLALKAYLLSKR